MATGPARNRDVRLALVLNGGVSLAIWIGGVTKEIDSARRAQESASDDGRNTLGLYAKLLNILRQDVVVDVIGGTSAGGINGVLLGAAIYNSRPLPDLREIWISLGDFRTLLRPATSDSPPSLMRGDDVVLPELRRQLRQLFEGKTTPPSQDLYVFVPATDLFGFPHHYSDSTGRTFRESDHRRVFSFSAAKDGTQPVGSDTVMRSMVWLGDPGAEELLARAGRSSSSFPMAFEAHRLAWADEGESSTVRSFVDGGILDNQPFIPVLNQMAILPARRPVKRVLMYVVPYVTDVGGPVAPAPESAPALATVAAALSLPRDLPKLQGLERVKRDQSEQRRAQAIRIALRKSQTPDTLSTAAKALFESYAWTRFTVSNTVFEAWADEEFKAGEGVLGQSLAWDPLDVPVDVQPVSVGGDAVPKVPWIPGKRKWLRSADSWTWGLSPAERAAAWIMLTLAEAQFPDSSLLTNARQAASELIAQVRSTKTLLAKAFRECSGDVITRAKQAYGTADMVQVLHEIQERFARLDKMIRSLNEGRDPSAQAATVQQCLDVEIVRNAFGIQEFAVPLPFEFVMASAGLDNALGHSASTPGTKLAGMKLNHFGGFLKRSWRANDWLWGRLDGVEHMLRALIDTDRIIELGPPAVADSLADLAFALEPGATEAHEDKEALREVWRDAVAGLGWTPSDEGGAKGQFIQVLTRAITEPAGSESSEGCLKACRRVLAARFQLRILADDLERVAETARDDVGAGTSRIASGVFWANRVKGALDGSNRVQLFRDMRVGEETLSDETSSRQVLDVGSQTFAVASSLLAGDRGGLPAGGRALLGSVRKLTLALSFPLRLLAREAWLGAASLAVLVGLVVWAATSKSTLLGATLPALALLTVIVGLALLTLATSIFEESLAKLSRVVGFVVFLGLPAAFVVLTRSESWPLLPDFLGSSAIAGWLDDKCRPGAVTTAAVFASIAVGFALVRLLFGPWLASHRRTVIGLYRWAVVGALGSLAIGFIAERAESYGSGATKGWPSIANDHRGAILVVVLLAVLLITGLLAELVIPFLIWGWRKIRTAL